MSEGCVFSRLIELSTDCPSMSIVKEMRDPKGDRLRKKGNVERALAAARDNGLDVEGERVCEIERELSWFCVHSRS